MTHSPATTYFRRQVPDATVVGNDHRGDDHLSVSIYQSVDEVDADAWNLVKPPQDIFVDLALLRALETMFRPEGAIPRYVIFRNFSSRPVAIACLYTYTIDATVLSEKKAQSPFRRFISRCLNPLMRTRLLMCGLPFTGGESSLRFAPEANVEKILEKLDRILHAAAREDHARCILFKEFRTEQLPQLAPLQQLGYLVADSRPMNEQCAVPASHDEFLKRLSSKRRSTIRRSARKFATSGIEIVTTADPQRVRALYTSKVHALYEAVFDKSKTKFEKMPPSFVYELVSHLPHNSEVIFALKDGVVVGFGLSIFDANSYSPLLIGVDYSISREFDLYLNLLDQTFDKGCRRKPVRILLGQNADECKRIRFGCTQSGRHFFIRGVKPWVHFAMKLLAKRLFPPHPPRPSNSNDDTAEHSDDLDNKPSARAA